MQATITIDGDLVIWPENSLECYALERWSAENVKDSNFPRMIIYGDVAAEAIGKEMKGLISEDELIALLKAKCDAVGLREYCRQTGLDPGNVSNVLRGKRCMQMRMGQVLGYEPVFMWKEREPCKPAHPSEFGPR